MPCGESSDGDQDPAAGSALLIRLQALHERYRLSVVEAAGSAPLSVIRIVCSDGLVG